MIVVTDRLAFQISYIINILKQEQINNQMS